MVKFQTNYAANIDLGHDAYIDYDLLKKKVHEIESVLSNTLELSNSDLHCIAPHTEFLKLLNNEMQKVDDIYTNEIKALTNDYLDIRHLQTLVNNTKNEDISQKANKKKAKKDKKAMVKRREEALKRALTATYHKSLGLENAAMLNRVASIKIMKKHDKIAKQAHAKKVFKDPMSIINIYNFGNTISLKELQNNLEDIYTDAFCDGLHEEAQGKLRLSKGEVDESTKTWIAFKAGVLISIMVWLLFQLVFSPKVSMTYITMEDPSIVVYAVVAGLLVFRWIWAFAVYMWELKHIDYILLLDLDAAKHAQKAQQIASNAFTYSILFTGNLLIFHCVRMLELYVNPANRFAGLLTWFADHVYIMPMSLLVGTALALVRSYLQPTSYGVFSSLVLIQLFQIPFTDVQLRHTFAADILSSFTKVMSAAAFSVCYFSSGAFYQAGDSESSFGAARYATCNNSTMQGFTALYILPLTMRVLQNVRQQYDHYRRDAKAALKNDASLANENTTERTNGEPNSGIQTTTIQNRSSSAVLPFMDEEHSTMQAQPQLRIKPSSKSSSYEQIVDIESGTGGADIHTNSSGKGHEESLTKNLQQSAEVPPSPMSARKGKDGLILALADDQDNEEEESDESSKNNDKLRHRIAGSIQANTRISGDMVRSSKDGSDNLRQLTYEVVINSESSRPESDANEAIVRLSEGRNIDGNEEKELYNLESTSSNVSGRDSKEEEEEEDAFDCNVDLTKTSKQKALGSGWTPSTSDRPSNMKLSHSESGYFFKPKISLQNLSLQRSPHSPVNSQGTDTRKSKSLHITSYKESGLGLYFDRVHPWLVKSRLPVWLIVWPYTYNMMRYILSILVVLFGVYRPYDLDPLSPYYMAWYIPLVIFSTFYNLYWDIVIDWDLLDANTEFLFLRSADNLYFKDSYWFYYVVMALDVVLRCMWTLHFTPYGGHPFLGVFELVRRGLWACLRMEVAFIRELHARSKLD